VSYVYAFLGFAALIVLHEVGHFAAAKAVGMRVERFSLFFGPMWVKRQIGETEYGIGTIPLGGYVKITGMTAGELFETPEIEARAYQNQPVWKRIFVIGAGPAVNLVLAFILAWVFFMGQSHVPNTANGQPAVTTTIAAVDANAPAAAALKPGDVLVSVDGVRKSPEAMRRQIESHGCASGAKVNGCRAATPVTVVVRRDGVLHTYSIRPVYHTTFDGQRVDESMLGFVFLSPTVANTAGYSAGQTVSGLWRVTRLTVADIAQIFRAKERRQLGSVAGAYEVTQKDFAASTSQGLEVLALISLSLAVINMFPFLPLDGGHIFWALVEKVRHRKVSLATIERAQLVGLALIVLLFVIGFSNDISQHRISLH